LSKELDDSPVSFFASEETPDVTEFEEVFAMTLLSRIFSDAFDITGLWLLREVFVSS